MGAALFIVLNREISGFDPFVNGKSLSKESETLDRIATKLGVKPLMEFFSTSPDEMAAFLEGEDVGEIAEMKFREESWFDPEDGLATVRSLLSYLRERPDAIGNYEEVISDLREFEQVLLKARDHGVKWHVSVDF